jgi:hypothetical protein
MDVDEFQAGDHLRISCEPRTVEVASADESYVYVRCPWQWPDPESKYRWDGETAFARDPDHYDFDRLWRLDPPPTELNVGQSCQLSIPSIEVVVVSVTRVHPSEDLGWLPRPEVALDLVPASDSPDDEDAVQALYLSEGEPIVIERLGRRA